MHAEQDCVRRRRIGNAFYFRALASSAGGPRRCDASGGCFLFKNSDQSLEGERTPERIIALGLDPGDEAVRADLAASTQAGEEGTQARVETLRRGSKRGAPKHTWSAPVLDQAACLVAILSLDDPLRRPSVPAPDKAEVRIPDSTSIPVRSRHFFFVTDAKPNRVIPFETAEGVVVDGSTVIPAGSLVAAFVDQASDVKEFGRGAKGQLQLRYLVLRDGTRVPLRGTVDLHGQSVKKGEMVAIGVLFGGGAAGAVTGSGFAIPAGTLLHAEVDGEQHIRANESTSGVAAK